MVRLQGSVGQRAAALTALALVALLVPWTSATQSRAAQTPVSCQSTVGLQNGGFEQPVVADGSSSMRDQSAVPGWNTTAGDGQIEIWRNHRGFSASAGEQHVELNATQPSTLYQDVATAPGQTLRWQLDHRGREGTDVMAVVVGPPAGPLVSQGDLVDDQTAWVGHHGIYTVPAGQTTTRFGFRAISTASGDLSVGNLLDNISFGTGACLVTVATVSTPTGTAVVNIGDLLTTTTTTTSSGGNPATATVLSDVLPAGVTFVPGSIRITGGTTSARTDAAGDDQADYDAGTRTVRARVGGGATAGGGGMVAPGEAWSMSYQVRVDRSSALSVVVNDAVAEFVEPLSGQPATSTSGQTNTTVAAAADLQTSVTSDSTLPVAGTTNRVVATVTNAGPTAADATVLRTTLPLLSGLSYLAPGGTCSVSGYELLCDFGTLPVGQARTVTALYDLPPGLTPSTVGDVTVRASGAPFDPVLLDNTASVSTRSIASADVTLAMTHSPSVPVAGTDVTYTITVGNDGPSTASGITVTDPVATGSSNIRASVAGVSCGPVGPSNAVSCAVAQLAPGATVTVSITVTLAPGGSGAVDNQAFVTAATPDPDSTDNAAAVQTPGTADADLEVALLIFTAAEPAGVDSGFPGDTVDYRLVITNHGPSTATNVSFQTVVPPGITVNRTPNPYCTPTACTLPGVMPGQVITITGTVTVAPGAPAGPGRATTTIVSPTPDSVPGNNSATVDFEILLSADLGVTQTVVNAADPAGPVVVGGDFTSTVTVSNAGPTRAEGLTVRQTIPVGQPIPTVATSTGTCVFVGDGTGGISVAGGTLVCQLAVLQAGDSWSFQLGSTLRSSWSDATFTRVRLVAASSPDPVPSNNTHTLSVPVVTRSDVMLSQTTDTPTVPLTDQIRFRVRVHNQGPSDVRNVLIQETPGGGMLLGGAAPSLGTYGSSTGTWFLASLPVGATAYLDVVGTAVQGASAVNSAAVLSVAGTDPDSTNDTAARTVTVIGPQDLTVTVDGAVLGTGLTSGGDVGNRVRWRYTVVNTGPVTLEGLLVQDAAAGPVICDTRILAPGGTARCSAVDLPAVTEADLIAGGIVRTARVSARLVGNPVPVVSAYAAASVGTAPPNPAISVVSQFVRADSLVSADLAAPAAAGASGASAGGAVTAAGTSGAAALGAAAQAGQVRAGLGDLVAVVYSVTNVGNVTLTGLTLTDPRYGTVSCPTTTLAPGTSIRCRTAVHHAVSAADVAAGRLVNEVRVQGAPPGVLGLPAVTADSTSEFGLRLPIAVVARPPGLTALPRTGSDVDIALAVASGLLLGGAVVWHLGRREPGWSRGAGCSSRPPA